MEIIHGRVESFHNDQLIVAIPHLDIFIGKLTDIGARSEVVECHELLGLAKLSVPENLADPIERLRQKLEPEATGKLARYEEDRGREIAGPAPDLDVLSRGLRLWFAQEYGGWIPAFGKNRTVVQFNMDPHVDGRPLLGSAVGEPEPTAKVITFEASDRGRGVRVGVLDTRIYPAEAMAGRYVAWPDAVIGPAEHDLPDSAGHCTFVASRILRQAPAAQLFVRPVLGDGAQGDTWTAATAMAEMAETGVDIMNLSFGQCSTDDDEPPFALQTAVDLISRRTVVVAAAGNLGVFDMEMAKRLRSTDAPVWPAACLGVTAVGALTKEWQRASFSPVAPWLSMEATAVNVPGVYLTGEVLVQHTDRTGAPVESTDVEFTGAATWSGTSFAAAAVSGKLAAGTVPAVRSAREALNDLLKRGKDTGADDTKYLVL